jgi:hypothetical protein
MLSFIKKFFGAKPTVNPCSDAPYKVEKSESKVAEFPFPSTTSVKSEKKTVAKKPATKKTRTPRKNPNKTA